MKQIQKYEDGRSEKVSVDLRKLQIRQRYSEALGEVSECDTTSRFVCCSLTNKFLISENQIFTYLLLVNSNARMR